MPNFQEHVFQGTPLSDCLHFLKDSLLRQPLHNHQLCHQLFSEFQCENDSEKVLNHVILCNLLENQDAKTLADWGCVINKG